METPTPTSAARESAANEFSAAFPPQFTVLGVKLLPLSIGRYRLMKYAEVAFVDEGESKASTDDLFTGIVICGMPCREFKDILTSGKIEKVLGKWGQKLRRMIRREKGFNVFEKIALFNRYIQEGQKLPWIPLAVSNGEAPDTTRTHWSSSVEVILRGHLGWTEEEIDERPLTKALCDYFKHMENEGCVRLMPHELYKAMIDEGEANMKAFEKIAEMQKGVVA
jgi:hypothetical protein